MGLFTSFLSPLFSKVFIAINVDASTCSIKLIRVKNTNILESFTKEFKTSENNIPMDAIKIVRKYRKEYPFTYVSVMIKSLAQGVVLQNDKKDILLGSIKLGECSVATSEHLNVFVKRSTLKEFLRRYNNIGGVDFVFSPFLIIDDNAQNFPTLGNNVYVLLQRSNIALMVIHKGKTEFSRFFIAQGEVAILNREEHKESELKNFDDFSLDEDFDDFSKIELNASLEHLQTDMFIPNLDTTKIVYDDMPKAKIISKIIVDAIKEYYQNPVYNGEFIDKVIFLDACKLSDQAFEYIAKEVMIETVKRDVDLPDILIRFARKELGGY